MNWLMKSYFKCTFFFGFIKFAVFMRNKMNICRQQHSQCKNSNNAYTSNKSIYQQTEIDASISDVPKLFSLRKREDATI